MHDICHAVLRDLALSSPYPIIFLRTYDVGAVGLIWDPLDPNSAQDILTTTT